MGLILRAIISSIDYTYLKACHIVLFVTELLTVLIKLHFDDDKIFFDDSQMHATSFTGSVPKRKYLHSLYKACLDK
jgi:hypothetical protein